MRYLGSIKWVTSYYFFWLNLVKIVSKTGEFREEMADIFNTVAKKTKFTISICKPGNTDLQSKVSDESYLLMETTYKVRITISNRPELIGEMFSRNV